MKRYFKRKQSFILVLYYLVSFIVVDYLLLCYFPLSTVSKKTNDLSKTNLSRRAISNPSICKSIKFVKSEGEIITVSYEDKLPSNSDNILSQFALSTSWLDQKIFFPLGSATKVAETANSISFRFFLPVIDQYNSSKLYCSTSNIDASSVNELKPHALSKHRVNLTVSDFDENNPNQYSRLRCHHKEIFALRWCEFRNIPYFDHHIFFFSSAHFDFPEPFIVPGPRAPPFDKTTDQLIIEPIVIQYNNFQDFSTKNRKIQSLSKVTDFCYIYGVFHNYYMLWHTVFDFMIPLYNFINFLNGTDTKANRRIYVKSDGVWSFHSLMKIFSHLPITIISENNPSILMLKGTIGIEKLESDPRSTRTYDDSISFQYEFTRKTAFGMREKILDELSIPSDSVGIDGQPLVLLIDRGQGSRNIKNIDALKKLMVDTCPFCKVETVKFHLMNVEEQIEAVTKASALVGLHGSGLAHVLWMQASRPNHTTHLVEIMPYMYNCRNWYNMAANVAGTEYHMVMNQKRPEGVKEFELIMCYSKPELCAKLQCHDVLRDQPTNLELDTFNKTWLPIVEKLTNTVTSK